MPAFETRTDSPGESSLLDIFDEMLKEHKTKNNNLNKSLLEQTQKLFENMLKPQNNLNYYA